MGNTDLGSQIRELRRARHISKADLSMQAGISVSHLEKIEAGYRRPGMETYQKFLEIMRLELTMRNESETTQEKCAAQAQELLMKSTAQEAKYLLKMLKYMSENLKSFL
ncbi:XRE family transcriptional regulator [Lachnospiraceae bacterium]|nr:XRE family transcriptional regulator [Lachnospiraceae bacterium]